MSWNEAGVWIRKLDVCRGGWQMPSIEQLASLFEPQQVAGQGYTSGGRLWPAHMDPVFSSIGSGSWVWSKESRGSKTARSFNFNQGIPVDYDRDNAVFTTRTFAVRP